MTNTQVSKSYDLEERTAKFGEEVIKFCRAIPRDAVALPVISQLIRAGTSVGANYCEADNAESKNDFKHKIGIAKKESRETMHWLRMIATAAPDFKVDARKLWKEAKELNLIFSAIVRSAKK